MTGEETGAEHGTAEAAAGKSAPVEFLVSTPPTGSLGTLLLAHGAGAAMDSSFMNRFTQHAVLAGLTICRFEFAYMAERRQSGRKRPPPAAAKLVGEFRTALEACLARTDGPVLIGGKSLGGRVAAMLGCADDLDARVAGVVCLGYPFHAPGDAVGDSEEVRLAPVLGLKRPTLIAQGERDPFGNYEEVSALKLPANVRVLWCEDGSHDLAPRGGSPATWEGNLRAAAQVAADMVG